MRHGKEIEQILAGSYVRPRQLTDVAHPDVLHPGAAGVTEAHLQASRLLCLSNLQFTAAKHKAGRANSCELQLCRGVTSNASQQLGDSS